MSDSPVFLLGCDTKPFKNLAKAKEAGDVQFEAMTGAIAMAFGLDSEKVVLDAFNVEMKAVETRKDIVDYGKVLSGHTIGAALIAKLMSGVRLAKDGDGSVTFSIVVTPGDENKDDAAVVQARFSGIAGVSASRGGGGGRRGSYDYFDGGTLISTSLKKHLLEVHPDSIASKTIRDYAERPNSAISAWNAAERGMKKGDSFVITRGEKKESTTESAPESTTDSPDSK